VTPRNKKTTALWILGCILSVHLGNATPTLAAPAPAPAPEPAALVVETPKPVAEEPVAAQAEAKTEPAAPQRTLREIKNSEMSVAVVKKAREIINENYKKPFGTEIDFEMNGKHFVGRIEQHYHPPGGELHPWGYHAGCSLYVVDDAG
jgi:hypothetical protein